MVRKISRCQTWKATYCKVIMVWISEARDFHALKLSHQIWLCKVRTIFCDWKFKNSDIWEISTLDAKETITRIFMKMTSTSFSIINCILKIANPFYACIEIRINSSDLGYHLVIQSSKRLSLSNCIAISNYHALPKAGDGFNSQQLHLHQ